MISNILFKEYLEKKNVSGYLLAAKTGIAQQTVSRYITGATDIHLISIKNASLIADFFEISVNEFLRIIKLKENMHMITKEYEFTTLKYSKSLNLSEEALNAFENDVISLQETTDCDGDGQVSLSAEEFDFEYYITGDTVTLLSFK